MERRIWRIDDRDECLNCFLRISRLLARLGPEVVAGFASSFDVFGQLSYGQFAGTTEEISAERTRLNDGDAHSEGFHLRSQGLAEAFHCKLGSVVKAPSSRAYQPADR